MDPQDVPASDSLAQPKGPIESTPIDELEQSLNEAEELLNHVKARFTQIRSAQDRQAQLEERLLEIEGESSSSPSLELKTELESIKTQLASTWEDLESQLITWRDQQELFWQFLRFSGVGFFLALLLNFLSKR
jgi:Uncharacterized conserved protein (DUF2203)